MHKSQDVFLEIRCPTCDRFCFCVEQLKNHNVEEHDNHPFVCKLCNLNVKRADNYLRHHNACLSRKNVDKICCWLCSKKFTLQRNLTRHIVEVHQKRTLNCVFCDARFSREHARDQHIVNVHDPRPSVNNQSDVNNSTNPAESSSNIDALGTDNLELPLPDPIDFRMAEF